MRSSVYLMGRLPARGRHSRTFLPSSPTALQPAYFKSYGGHILYTHMYAEQVLVRRSKITAPEVERLEVTEIYNDSCTSGNDIQRKRLLVERFSSDKHGLEDAVLCNRRVQD